MNKLYLYTAFVFVTSAVAYFAYPIIKTNLTNNTPSPKIRGIAAAFDRLQRIKQNQNTHNYSLTDVYAAQYRANQQKAERDACVAPLVWEDLGPNNVGGRSRSLLVDKDNPNRLYTGSVAGGLFISNNGGNSWQPYGGNDTLSTLSIGCIVQGTDGTIYVGTGEYYENGYPYGLDASKSPGYGMFRSTDGGQSFQALPATQPQNYTSQPNNFDWAFVIALATDPTNANRLYAATQRGIYVSTDKGDTWAHPANVPTSVAWDIDVDVNGKVYAAAGGGSWVSTDGGVTFANISGTQPGNAPNTGNRRLIALSPNNANYAYLVTVSNGCIDKVYQSSDGGNVWIEIGEGDEYLNPCSDYCQCWYDLAMAVDPANPEHIYLGGVTLWRWMSDGGWVQVDNLSESFANPLYVHADKHFVVFDTQTPNRAYIACDGGIFRTNNAANLQPSFIELNKNYNVTQMYSVSASYNGEVMGGAQDNGTNYMGYDHNSFGSSVEVMGGDGAYTEISHIKPDIFFAESQNGFMARSANRGEGFSSFFDENIDGDGDGAPDAGAPFITPFFLWEDAQRFFYGDGEIDAKFFTGDNAGKLWLTRNPLDVGTTPHWEVVTDLGSSPLSTITLNSGGDIAFAGSEGGKLMRVRNLNTPNPTNQFIPNTPFDNRYLAGLAVDAGNPNNLAAVAGNYGNYDYVFLSQNAMASTPANVTFQSIQHNLPRMPIYDVAMNPGNPDYYLIIGTELGVWSYNLNQQCWTEHNTGLGRVPVYRVRLQNIRTVGCEVLYIGTHGRGIMRSTTLTYPFCDTALSFSTGVDNAATTNSLQLQISPNPMSSQATINYQIASNTKATISIYNLQGQIVQTQQVNYGTSSIQINRNQLPAGTYMVSLTTDNGNKISKKLLVY